MMLKLSAATDAALYEGEITPIAGHLSACGPLGLKTKASRKIFKEEFLWGQSDFGLRLFYKDCSSSTSLTFR
jgi:hypothetical protein